MPGSVINRRGGAGTGSCRRPGRSAGGDGSVRRSSSCGAGTPRRNQACGRTYPGTIGGPDLRLRSLGSSGRKCRGRAYRCHRRSSNWPAPASAPVWQLDAAAGSSCAVRRLGAERRFAAVSWHGTLARNSAHRAYRQTPEEGGSAQVPCPRRSGQVRNRTGGDARLQSAGQAGPAEIQAVRDASLSPASLAGRDPFH